MRVDIFIMTVGIATYFIVHAIKKGKDKDGDTLPAPTSILITAIVAFTVASWLTDLETHDLGLAGVIGGVSVFLPFYWWFDKRKQVRARGHFCPTCNKWQRPGGVIFCSYECSKKMRETDYKRWHACIEYDLEQDGKERLKKADA